MRTSRLAAHRCEYCRAPESIFNFPFEVEHIVPPIRGGTDDLSNFALACRSCNLRKGVHVAAADPETGVTADLFHPRRHDWPEHFEVEIESGSIFGVTEIGRATVARLEMNSPPQVAARLQWAKLGLSP